jgi:hypothetical protein
MFCGPSGSGEGWGKGAERAKEEAWHLRFAKSVPITSARGIITPATYWRNFGGSRVRKGWDNKQFTALVSRTEPLQSPLHLLRLQLLDPNKNYQDNPDSGFVKKLFADLQFAN